MSLTTSIITGGSSNHETTSTEANATATDFFTEGVVGAITNTSGVAPATGAFAVNAQGSPNMTVAVSSGVAYTTATPTGQTSQLLRTYNSASSNVTISANSSGSTKYDWIYIKIDPDNAANSNAAADNVATLVASRSSSSTTDDGTPPTYGTLLAVVTVANGASSIANASISDRRERSNIADSSVTYTKAAAGFCVQEVSTNSSAVATGTTVIPYDDTIPQITEGTEAFTVAITPKATTHRLVIEASVTIACSVANNLIIALFQDSTANALAAAVENQATANGTTNIKLRHEMAAGTTSSTTFRIRYGGNAAGTFTLNGDSGNRKFGGITCSSITVREYKA